MLAEIIENPDLEKYLVQFETGQIVFLEGDESQDLYILISGKLNVLKGNKKISEISESGTLFGEMSFLLDASRTATVKASDDVKAIRIPKDEINTFLSDFSSLAWEITKVLAKRLDKTSQILYGLKEFCDQLPDAVIMTDRDGKILTCNSAAEKLYGMTWEQLQNKTVEAIYEEPENYKTFIEEVQSRYAVREKILKTKHPEKGTRFISTSTTILYDGQHNSQGVLSLGLDVTSIKHLEKRYERIRFWLIPCFIFFALAAAFFFFAYPHLPGSQQAVDVKKLHLKNQIAKDYLLLKSLLITPFIEKNRKQTNQVMADFFDIQEDSMIPYTGCVILDSSKKVFDAYSPVKGAEVNNILGESYAGIKFRGDESSIHRVLTVYRTSKDHPMGHKGIEMAFEIYKDDLLLGWLVFQMDIDLLFREYGIDEDDLRAYEFKAQGR